MKVINEWDGAPAQTPTQIIREWYAEHHRDIENYGIDAFHAAELMSALAPLFSAGPWRYDVENAPKDGSEVLLAIRINDEDFCLVGKWHENYRFWSTSTGLMPQDKDVSAFATINQPEIQG